MPLKPTTVDQYLDIGCGRCELGGTVDCKVVPWVSVLAAVRASLLASELSEQIKWSSPCYTFAGKNVLMLSAMKDRVVVSFFQGAQLEDPENILQKPGENSRFARYIAFDNLDDFAKKRAALAEYIPQAIKLVREGVAAQPSDSGELDYPEELIQVFEQDPEFQEAFSSLTPGRQRGYLIHYTSAKQSKTKTTRIEKSKSKVLQGKGWNER